jgi:NAD(P)-dependent dehydrogenase (short-subunit alcohol dehydrogenase family)
MKRLDGKVVMVFGAGSSGPGWGNGKAAAVAYAREGARVVAIDLDAAAVGETVAAIESEGFQALALTADVTDSASVVAAVAKTMAAHERIDVLHNNVGVTTMGGPPDLDEAAWQRSLDINVGSVYRTTRAIIPQMQAQGSGVIINISSLASIRWSGYPYFAYYASKAAVNQATVAIALQYARDGIRANAILPGAIDTPLIYKQIAAQYKSVEEMREARNRAIPTGRMGTAWDIAYAAVFLASDEASFITGVCLPVDGGQSCSLGMPQ